jgi:hypothetical protein
MADSWQEQLYQQVSGEMFDMVKEYLTNYKKQFSKVSLTKVNQPLRLFKVVLFHLLSQNLPTGAVGGLVQLWKCLQPSEAVSNQELVKLLQV